MVRYRIELESKYEIIRSRNRGWYFITDLVAQKFIYSFNSLAEAEDSLRRLREIENKKYELDT